MSRVDRGRYEVLSELGRGGMGVVYRVRDRLHERDVALKAILGDAEPMLVKRFVREARATAALEHPALVPTYEIGRHGNDLHFTMRLVQGSTLTAVIRSGKHTVADLVRCLLQVARGVAYAHARGLVHRDLKPDNVMVDEDGSVQILDWGLVGASCEEAGSGLPTASTTTLGLEDSKLTMAGELMGTPAYMSPEQAAGRSDEVGPASDVYALGAILYEILTGVPPFRARSAREILCLVREGKFETPSAQAEGREVPPEVQAICLRSMSREARDRYPSAGAMADDLEAWLEGRTVSVLPPPWPVRLSRFVARHRLASFAVVLLLFTVATSFIYQAGRARRNEETRRARLEDEHRQAEETRDQAARLLGEWKKDFARWKGILEGDDRMIGTYADLPPAAAGMTQDEYRGEIERVIAAFPWDQRAILLLRKNGEYARGLDSLDESYALRRLADRRRQEVARAESSFSRLAREGHSTPGLTEPREALVDLAKQDVEFETEAFLDADWRMESPEWALQTPVLSRNWESLAEKLPSHWSRLVEALHRLEEQLRESGRAPRDDELVRKVRAILDGRGRLTIAPVPVGWSATLHRLNGDSLWVRQEGAEVVDAPEAGLEFIAEVPSAGAVLDVPVGDLVLRLRGGGHEVRQPVVVGRGAAAEIVPDAPLEFPAGTIRVPGADHRIAQFEYWTHTEGFFLQRTEVSLGEFRRFLEEAAASNRDFLRDWFDPTCRSPGADGRPIPFPLELRDGRWERGNSRLAWDEPVLCVSFFAAAAYARWLAEKEGWDWRIPNMHERCLAAGGTLGHPFDWGLVQLGHRARTPTRRTIHGALYLQDGFSQWTATAVTQNLVSINAFSAGAGPDQARPDFAFRLACRKRTR